jgi:type IV pilus assembly protein PilN
MLVDINLLPKREVRNSTRYIIGGFILLILILGSILLFLTLQSYNTKIEETERQISSVQTIIKAEQENIKSPKDINSTQMLKDAVTWAEKYPLPTMDILSDFIKLLPQRGFIESLSYQESGLMTLTVRFDTIRDAAYYLKYVKAAEGVNDVTLHSIASNNLIEAADVNVLPRYSANYEINLKKEYYKKDDTDMDQVGDEIE